MILFVLDIFNLLRKNAFSCMSDAVPWRPKTALSRSWQFEKKHSEQIMAKNAPRLLCLCPTSGRGD